MFEDGCEKLMGWAEDRTCGEPISFVFTCSSCETVQLLCASHGLRGPGLDHMIHVMLAAREAAGTLVSLEDLPCSLEDQCLDIIVAIPRRSF